MQITILLKSRRLPVALLGVLAAGLLAMSLQAKPAVAQATCTDSLQAKVDAAPSGGTVTANPCIYRQHLNIKKPMILKGRTDSLGNKSEIRGSDVWASSNFSKLSDGTWRSST